MYRALYAPRVPASTGYCRDSQSGVSRTLVLIRCAALSAWLYLYGEVAAIPTHRLPEFLLDLRALWLEGTIGGRPAREGIEESEYVRKADVDEDRKETRLQGFKDRLTVSNDPDAEVLR